MVTIRFTYYAQKREDGRHEIHLYLSQFDPTWTDGPREERLAERDAAQIVRDIVGENVTGEDNRLLKDGDPPEDAIPVFMFAIGINWSRKLRIAHYSRVCYQRYLMDGKWNPVASLGMEQLDYTMSVLRKREKIELKSKGVR